LGKAESRNRAEAANALISAVIGHRDVFSCGVAKMATQTVFILRILTHAAYARGDWKKEL
jgi:hypothetical protein